MLEDALTRAMTMAVAILVDGSPKLRLLLQRGEIQAGWALDAGGAGPLGFPPDWLRPYGRARQKESTEGRENGTRL